MVAPEHLDINEGHPLASEISSLRTAVTRLQDEAYSSSVKLQRQSLEVANAHDRVVHLERENDLLRSELAVLRAHPHPDASPQAHPAALQVRQLTLSLRRLSDKLSLTEEALLERTTQLAHATGEATKAKLAAEGAYELAARTRGREEAGKLRELELERKVKAAEEAVKMSDLVVNEYADLVRSLEAKTGARPTTGSHSSSSSLSLDGHAQNGGATLTGSLAEGKLGLQRLLFEFSAETENLQKDLLRVQGELAASEARRDSEKKCTEQCQIELAQAQFELQQLKVDDNAAAKMVSRYMKFSQKSTDALQDSLTALKTRHTATYDTLSAQLSHISSRLHFSDSQTEKLRHALDELGGEMVKETYGRRREVALRIRMVNREEKLREELERWVLRAGEALGRENLDPGAVQERMIQDARAVLVNTLGGASGSSDGSVARLITAQHAVEVLTTELEHETRRRLELERILAQEGRAVPTDRPRAKGNAVNHTPPLVDDELSPEISLLVTPPTIVSAALPTPAIVINGGVSSPSELEASPGDKSVLVLEGPSPDSSPLSDRTSVDEEPERPLDLRGGAPLAAFGVSTAGLRSPERLSSFLDPSPTPIDPVTVGIPEQPLDISTDTSLQQLSTEDKVSKRINTSAVLNRTSQRDEVALDPADDDGVSYSTTKDLEIDLALILEPALPVESEHDATKEKLASLLTDQAADELQTPESIPEQRDTPSSSPSPSISDISVQNSHPSSHATPVATHLDIVKPMPHPLLTELSKSKHRYDALQRALRDCHLALETLSTSVPTSSDPGISSGSVRPNILSTALQRLNDYTEDARVELEIRTADEALVARGFETLLSVRGALSSASVPSDNQDQDAPSRGEVERQVEEFVSGTDPGVDKALRSLARKLEDIEHDIAVLKRAVHNEVVAPSSPLTAPATNGVGGGWTSWIRSSPSSPATSPASRLGSTGGPTPTFGNVMTTPRLRHSPSLNFQGSLGRGMPGEAARDPLMCLGLRVPMPSYIYHVAQHPQPQPRSRTLSTMYMLGLGARRPSAPLAPSSGPRKSGRPPSLTMKDTGTETEEETDTDDVEDDTDVE